MSFCFAPFNSVSEPPQFQTPAATGIRLTKPANGAAFAMPELNAKPPFPQMPGGPMRSGPKNGV